MYFKKKGGSSAYGGSRKIKYKTGKTCKDKQNTGKPCPNDYNLVLTGTIYPLSQLIRFLNYLEFLKY